MSKFSCLIVDDEDLSRSIIEQHIKLTDFLELEGSCSGAIEASKILKEKKIDILFLDVEMPDMTGLEFLETLTSKPQVILVTGKEDYALSAFEYDVVDYLLKPVAYPRFLKAVNKATNISLNVQNDASLAGNTLFVKVDSRLLKIDINDLLYVEAMGDYVVLTTNTGKYTAYSTMKNIVSKLPPSDFIRVHRSFIVRADKIMDITESNLVIGKHIIPIGGSFKQDLLQRLNIL